MSCSSTKMGEVCEELKWLLITYLVFYTNALVEIILLYRVRNEKLAVGQAVMCLLFSMGFYFFFIWPKVWYILFRSKDGEIVAEHQPVQQEDEEAGGLTTAISSADAFKHHGVVQMRVKDVEE